MKVIADLHIHSKYSRAVSKRMILEELDRWADDKGITVLGTGDFTHPVWFRELEKKLEPAEPGLFRLKKKYQLKTLKGTFAETRFLLSVEIACIYSRGGKVRRVHHVILAPDLATAGKINRQLSVVGKLASDGRPILGLDSEELARIVFGINPECVIIPAHAWTPWFGVLGSMSGFDSLEECFGEFADRIFAIETGLSSDPAMNWRVPMLDKISFISNSDSHSPERIGREANIFNCELSYDGIISAMKSRNPKKFLSTVEFFPEEGKYHYDGHRACGMMMTPEETKRNNGLCLRCGKKSTIGVVYRVDQLAHKDRPEGYRDGKRIPFRNLVTLDKIIGEALGKGAATKAVRKEYEKLVKAFGSEFNLLLDVPKKEIASVAGERIAEAVERVRLGKLHISPGYDGEFGTISIFGPEEK